MERPRGAVVEGIENPALDPSRPVPPLVSCKVNGLRPGMKHLRLAGIVLEKGKPFSTSVGEHVVVVKFADETGVVDLTAFDDRGEALTPGDICEIRWGYTQERDGVLRVYIGKLGQIFRTGRFTRHFSEAVDMSTRRDWAASS
jgi:hypothetical protein